MFSFSPTTPNALECKIKCNKWCSNFYYFYHHSPFLFFILFLLHNHIFFFVAFSVESIFLFFRINALQIYLLMIKMWSKYYKREFFLLNGVCLLHWTPMFHPILAISTPQLHYICGSKPLKHIHLLIWYVFFFLRCEPIS